MVEQFLGIHKAPGSILTTLKRKRTDEPLPTEVMLSGHSCRLPKKAEVIAGEAPECLLKSVKIQMCGKSSHCTFVNVSGMLSVGKHL